MASGGVLTVDGSALKSGYSLTFDGSAETDGSFVITGGAGNDTIFGGALADTFDLTGGGNDTAQGGGGDDTFAMGAALTAADAIDGGAGSGDTIYLDGDYSGGLTLGATTMTNVEELLLGFYITSGYSYNLTTNNAAVASGQTLVVNAAYVDASQTLTFDGSAETDGSFYIYAGAGDDVLTGGDFNDTFQLYRGGADTVYGGGGVDKIYMGSRFTAANLIDGGAGNDSVYLSGDYHSGLTFGASTMVNVETLTLGVGFDYQMTTNDATVASGATLAVDASALGLGDKLTFNGLAESDGSFAITGGATGDEVLLSGAALLNGSTFDGGGGTDTLIVVSDSDVTTTFTAATISSVSEIDLIGSGSFDLTLVDANVAAGDTLRIEANTTFVFDGSAETDGSFRITDGNGDDALTGGALVDTFLIVHGGIDTVHGGGGDDQITMGATLTAADAIDGGAGLGDSVYLSGDYSGGLTFGTTTMTNVEGLFLSVSHSYDLTTDDATVAAAQELYVDASGLGMGDSLTFDGSAETDGHFHIIGGIGDDTLTGGDQADILVGYDGADTYKYTASSQSTSTTYDTVYFNADADKFDLNTTVAGYDGSHDATVSSASFDTDIGNAMNDYLSPHDAIVIHATAGDLIGHDFLIVDVNNNSNYDAGTDYVFDISYYTGTIDTGDFI